MRSSRRARDRCRPARAGPAPRADREEGEADVPRRRSESSAASSSRSAIRAGLRTAVDRGRTYTRAPRATSRETRRRRSRPHRGRRSIRARARASSTDQTLANDERGEQWEHALAAPARWFVRQTPQPLEPDAVHERRRDALDTRELIEHATDADREL